jgi:ATP-binding cassette subfamily C protein
MLTIFKKLSKILTKKNNLVCLTILLFSLTSALVETVTAIVFVLLAISITDASKIVKYLKLVGFKGWEIPSKIDVILYLSLICGILYFVKSLVCAAEVFYKNLKIQRMNYEVKNRILHKYAQIDYGVFLTRNSSYGLSVITEDIETLFSKSMVALASILSESLVLFGLIAVVAYLAPMVSVFLLSVSIILIFFVYKFWFPVFYAMGRKYQEATLAATKNLLVFFSGFKEIIMFGKQLAFISVYKKYVKQKALTWAKSMSINSIPRISIEFLFVMLFVFAILFMAISNYEISTMSGILGGYLYASFRIMPSLNKIVTEFNNFQYQIPSIERIYEEFYSKTQDTKVISIPDFKFEDKLELKNVSFRYLNTKSDVLNGVNLVIKKNSCLGIVGETGSGKSTLIDLIIGLLHPVTGEILVDGKYSVSCEEWHSIVGYVSQTVYLFDDTIKANIVFGESAEEINNDNLQMAIGVAQLEKFVNKLTNGVDTIIGDRGIKLSGGERQRIAIARALYKKPSVLILDEATSSLDAETESQLMATINKLSKNYTMIMVAHRLNTLKSCDRIIELSDGHIVETQYSLRKDLC